MCSRPGLRHPFSAYPIGVVSARSIDGGRICLAAEARGDLALGVR